MKMDCLKTLLVKDEAAADLEMIDHCEEDKLKPAFREGTIEFWKSVLIKNDQMPNGLRLKYCQCLDQHTSESLFLLP